MARQYRGHCHCGGVRFEVAIEEPVECVRCNCSICAMSGFVHLIVPKSHFRLLAGEDQLTIYSFNTGVAKHTFCKVCGIKPFYIPRSNPDGVDINLNCLETRPEQIHIQPFDGQNWEQNAHALAHKSRE